MAGNIVVLISGSGTNLQAIIDACKEGRINASISAVISNKADAFGLERAKQAAINTVVVNPKQYSDRESYDIALAEAIEQQQADLIVMAGFMRILSPHFVERFAGKMLNIHPSLLPKYQGLHTHQRAIDAKDQEHGCSVHFVTAELDGGPVVLQAKVPVFEEDSADELADRVQVQEHAIYPLVVNWFIEQRLVMQGDYAELDGQQLPSSGYADN
ncbi:MULTISPECIES: phosphoribosylglycinamide formyltransferase [unclassified Agarivorans]|uniref:phosphoribosylglycinamide formyltransferase n=1 Tax=unclassified Agarivorans TaxID=2636026 RepID=UPI0026E24786|nr:MULTISPECIES: phosphoribosylglycinamide formyltransferase [unclassified Agarivorans]MDO6687966.1 phosphoribosylglycinamide formyltransferase [Agarivorans sp. 3_MG-2023]MDO6717617.1 phosphoribosylglycinamide formyltransferase [Agarivorans sp. 2_MG-2023]